MRVRANQIEWNKWTWKRMIKCFGPKQCIDLIPWNSPHSFDDIFNHLRRCVSGCASANENIHSCLSLWKWTDQTNEEKANIWRLRCHPFTSLFECIVTRTVFVCINPYAVYFVYLRLPTLAWQKSERIVYPNFCKRSVKDKNAEQTTRTMNPKVGLLIWLSEWVE